MTNSEFHTEHGQAKADRLAQADATRRAAIATAQATYQSTEQAINDWFEANHASYASFSAGQVRGAIMVL